MLSSDATSMTKIHCKQERTQHSTPQPTQYHRVTAMGPKLTWSRADLRWSCWSISLLLCSSCRRFSSRRSAYNTSQQSPHIRQPDARHAAAIHTYAMSRFPNIHYMWFMGFKQIVEYEVFWCTVITDILYMHMQWYFPEYDLKNMTFKFMI